MYLLGHKAIQEELPRNDASYFLKVLRINDPAKATSSHVLDKHALPMFDMVTRKLNTHFPFYTDGKKVEPHDYILWPLNAMKKHDDWLKTQVRPKAKQLAHEVVNLKGDGGGYFET